jgi:hypothetical protein
MCKAVQLCACSHQSRPCEKEGELGKLIRRLPAVFLEAADFLLSLSFGYAFYYCPSSGSFHTSLV